MADSGADLLETVERALQEWREALARCQKMPPSTTLSDAFPVEENLRAAYKRVTDGAPEWLAALVTEVRALRQESVTYGRACEKWEERVRRAEQEREHEFANARAILKKYKETLAEADRAEAEVQRLRHFFEKCWDHARDGTDVEGFDVQEWGEQLGLLKPVEASAPCGEGCYCAEYYGEFPATCYRIAWGSPAPGPTPQP